MQTAIGRTGRTLRFEHARFLADVLSLGKGIGGGVPLAALLALEDFCLFEAGDQGGTYNGNPLMTAVGHAVVEKIANIDFLDEVKRNGDYLASRLKAMSLKLGLGEVRG